MSIRTIINSVFGLYAVPSGSGVQIVNDVNNEGFGPFKVNEVGALTTATTLVPGNAGVNTISGSGALTMVMPLAASCAGASFIFRSLSAHGHAVTASQETAGTTPFIAQNGAVGSKATMAASVGASMMLVSDGKNFIICGPSASVAVSGT